MSIFYALFGFMWWATLYGLFDIMTGHYTKEEKIKLYLYMLGIITIIICFCPKILSMC